jgi:hypothetical protein
MVLINKIVFFILYSYNNGISTVLSRQPREGSDGRACGIGVRIGVAIGIGIEPFSSGGDPDPGLERN